jgi:hypothetical protein
MKRYTQKVENGIKLAIAMLEIDAEHIRNTPAREALLNELEDKPKLSPQDKQQMEEYLAAAEWLRDLVAGYQRGHASTPASADAATQPQQFSS